MKCECPVCCIRTSPLGIWIGYLALPSQSATASIPELELRQLWATRVSFTNQNQDTSPQLYDFLYREYNPYQGGRWASPDPAGLGAVDITDSADSKPVRLCWQSAADLCRSPRTKRLGRTLGWLGWLDRFGSYRSGAPHDILGIPNMNDVLNAAMGFSSPNNGTQTSERLTRLKNCALAYYGIDPLSVSGLTSNGAKWGSIATAAGGIPKAIPEGLGLVRKIRQSGSSDYTSLFSILSAASGGGGTLRTIANFGSKWAGPIAIASGVIDATAIGICTAMD